jgi:hypothetical protein
LSPACARAQVVPGEGASIGTLAADRARVAQLTQVGADSAYAETLRLSDSGSAGRVRSVRPSVRLVWNSQLPYGGNDAGLWAGRGANGSVTGGAALRRHWEDRIVDVIVAPTIAFSQNAPFSVAAGRQAGRSAFSSPWHLGQSSADLPLRFGDRAFTTIGLGESSITITSNAVAYGASAASEWWGPALRNTLLLSNNPAGVPRLFVRTARPIHTRFGEVEGRIIIGGLTESPYFDAEGSNDTRSLSGVLVTLRPAVDSGLVLGLSRLVVSRLHSRAGVLLHSLDVFTRFDPIVAPSDASDTTASTPGTDQLFSLFARWVFPASGFETYVEWARMELPRSIRELFEVPQSTQGYTLGLQWAGAQRQHGFLRLQGEVTYLEQTQVIANRPPPDFYTGRAAVQGFTQRGQILGAAIGPGSSTQFLGADWLARRWQLGLFAGRTRTENDALYRQVRANPLQHDVTIFSGLRGGARLPWSDVAGELTVGRRLNYLFQNSGTYQQPIANDYQNITLGVTISPR